MGLEVSLMINEGLIWMGLGVGLMIMRVNLDGAGGVNDYRGLDLDGAGEDDKRYECLGRK